MQVSKWGNTGGAPSAVVEALGLKEGDHIEIRVKGDREFEITPDHSRSRALSRLRRLRRSLPRGFVFDREEANAR